MNNENLSKWGVYASHLGSYMRRWIARSPVGTVRLHNILRSDEGRDFHDHPFDFTSVILWGGYVEHVPGCSCRWEKNLFSFDGTAHSKPTKSTPCRYFPPGSVVRRTAENFHRLELVTGPAWTFVIAGRYRRVWGFLLKNGTWQNHEDYKAQYLTKAPLNSVPAHQVETPRAEQ